jgi:asparagine synthase (glutamine-hydrolysing)
MPNLAPTLLDHSQMIPWAEDLIALAKRIEEPFDFHMTQPRLCYLAARRAGLKVLLDGGAGDVVLGHGSQMARHVRAGRLLQAWKDAKGLQAFWGAGSEGPLYQLYAASRGAFMPDALRRLRAAWRDRGLPPLPEGSAVDPDFAERVGLRRSLQERGALPQRMSFAEERIRSWPRSGLTVGRERYDRVAAALGMEARDPYMDRRVMMFCLSLPMDQFQANGWPKMIQRRAMAGLLPDPVRWRRGKEHLGWTFTQTLLRHWPDWPAAIPAQAPALAGRAMCVGMSFEQQCTTPEKAPEPVLNHVLPTALFLATVLPNTASSTKGSV